MAFWLDRDYCWEHWHSGLVIRRLGDKMIARKLMNLVVSLAVLLVVVPRVLKIPYDTLVPGEARYVLFAVFIVVGLYVAFKLSRFIAATDDERHLIRSDFLLWMLPFGGGAPDEDIPRELVVKESRIVMLLNAIGALTGLVVLALLNSKANPPPLVQAVMLFMAGLMILSSLFTLLRAIIADELVTVTAAGLGLPVAYKALIPWDAIYTVEMRRGKQGAKLFVHFKNPEGPASWRGIWGKIKGHFAHANHEGTLTVSLEHTGTDPYDIQVAIDRHLKSRDMAVVMPD